MTYLIILDCHSKATILIVGVSGRISGDNRDCSVPQGKLSSRDRIEGNLGRTIVGDGGIGEGKSTRTRPRRGGILRHGRWACECRVLQFQNT